MITDILRMKVLEGLVADGTIPENILRDERIRQEYFSIIDDSPDVNKGELREKLSDKYCIGLKSIEAVLYRKKKLITR